MYQLPPDIQPENILIYLRKSRTDDPALSVEEVLAKHEQMLDEWSMRTLGRLVPNANRYREVASGETIAARPQVQAVLRALEHPGTRAVLVVEPQRLSRGDLEDAGYIIKILRYTHTVIITPVFSYDLTDERDRDLFQRELQRGNEFLEYQKRIMLRGRMLAVENGCYIGNRPPYGYDKTTIRIGKRVCYTLKPNDCAPVVRLIYKLYLEGYGKAKLAIYLEEHGIPAPSGALHWNTGTFARMLTNPHYIGKVVWNRRKTEISIEDGAVVARRPIHTDYLVYDGLHEGIVDPDVWEAVQRRIGKNPRVNRRGRMLNPYAGLLFCRCGHAMSRHPEQGNGKDRLICTDQRHCHTPSVRLCDLTAGVIASLRRSVADMEIKVAGGASLPVESRQVSMEVLERRCDELRATELRQWELYASGKMPQDIFDQLNGKILRERQQAEETLAAIMAETPEETPNLAERISTLHAAMDMLVDPTASAADVNQMLKECISRIVYSREVSPDGRRDWGTNGPRPTPIDLDIQLLL